MLINQETRRETNSNCRETREIRRPGAELGYSRGLIIDNTGGKPTAGDVLEGLSGGRVCGVVVDYPSGDWQNR